MKRSTGLKLVLVEWIDSHSGAGWKPLDDLTAYCEPCHCRSVGWLVADQNGMTLLVPHLSGEADGNVEVCGNGRMVIPNKAITKVTVLRSTPLSLVKPRT